MNIAAIILIFVGFIMCFRAVWRLARGGQPGEKFIYYLMAFAGVFIICLGFVSTMP